MKTDSEIRDDVTSELEWDPQITDPEAIGVAVQDGAVTLTGHVPTYAERLAAVRRGGSECTVVKAVANDLQGQTGRRAAGRLRHRQWRSRTFLSGTCKCPRARYTPR